MPYIQPMLPFGTAENVGNEIVWYPENEFIKKVNDVKAPMLSTVIVSFCFLVNTIFFILDFFF